jgi:hypothetical protein
MRPPEGVAGGSVSRKPIVPDASRARLWTLVAGFFLIVGCLALSERVWTLAADWHARRTWPSADGEIVSGTQQDDSDLSRKVGSIRGRTRYWVEYHVRFAVPAERCRTGAISEAPSQPMPCQGVVRTRSTQSTAEVFQWFLHGYQVNQRVQVLWNPEGTGTSDIKIAGEPLSLWYNLDRLALSVLWVLGFGALWLFFRRRVPVDTTDPRN